MVFRRWKAVLAGIAAASGLLLPALAAPVAAAEPPAPGTGLRDCPECPELVVVPAGSFVMGSADGPKYARPAHRVTLVAPFAIGVFEVTFDEWQACVAAGGCDHDPDDHGWGRGRRPVINVTAADVERYLAWLSAATGHAYRLPSESEWEYAARAGTATAYWWGDAVGEGRANCRQCASRWSGVGTAPVGSFAANRFGLFDTAGNVWEWTADCWNPDHTDAPADGTARRTGDCGYRVIRSGSWYYFPKLSRSDYRHRNDARVKSYNIGFRVARDLP